MIEVRSTTLRKEMRRSTRLYTYEKSLTDGQEDILLSEKLSERSPVHGDHIRSLSIPIVDLSGHRGLISELIVKACEEFGFFQVINHGVPAAVISQMETIALDFFSLPAVEKQRAGPPNPLGYGSKAIGQKGDSGEVEYLLLHANPSMSQRDSIISRMNPTKFRYDIMN